jgi:RNA polymerase sigma-70 factor (ECF subfamily)
MQAHNQSDNLTEWLALQRPALHRYCSRLTGSVIDGEDAVQETLLKAMQAFPGFDALDEPKAWLFRVAHNATMDLLRSRARVPSLASDDFLEAVPDPGAADTKWIARSALRYFMWLTPIERSCVVLMDVLGYTLQEISGITGRSVLAVKAALHRGRLRLKEVVDNEDAAPTPSLTAEDSELLEQYAARFNARDFDGVRAMLGDEVRLDLVGRRQAHGKSEVGNYLRNYESVTDWHFLPGVVEGTPALIARDPADAGGAAQYVVLLRFAGGKVARIRDFRHARYAADMLALTDVNALGAQDWRVPPSVH